QVVNLFANRLFERPGNFLDREQFPSFIFYRRHRHIRNSAGNDARERREIAANIEREAVHCDPMPDTDANRRDLALLDPNASEPFAPRRGDFVAREKIDQRLLEPAQITMQILAAAAKIDNRIAHQLAGTMISRLAAAIDREKR